MKPAAPTVDRATVWIDTVKKGEMLRQVRGLGTLVPEEVRWIPAISDGIIEEVRHMAGDSVKADTIILVMSNPDVLHAATDAELAVKSSEADLANLRATLRNQIVNQQSEQASVKDKRFKRGPSNIGGSFAMSQCGSYVDFSGDLPGARPPGCEGRLYANTSPFPAVIVIGVAVSSMYTCPQMGG